MNAVKGCTSSYEAPDESLHVTSVPERSLQERVGIGTGWICAGICLITLIIWLSLNLSVHWAGSMEGWVIDQETGNPIEGVIVSANWQSEIRLPDGSRPGDQIAIREAVSDRTGHFRLDSWGPKFSTRRHAPERKPQLLLFKSGYEYRRVNEDVFPRRLGMKRFNGNLEAYAAHLTGLSSALESPTGIMEGGCDWRELPLMLRALDEQDTMFRVERLRPLTLTASLRMAEKFYLERGCGSVEALLLKGRK